MGQRRLWMQLNVLMAHSEYFSALVLPTLMLKAPLTPALVALVSQ